jgi:flagellar basal body-associated protein FliL
MTRAGTAWRMAQCRPGSDPLGALARALAADGVLLRGYEAEGLTLVEIIDTTLRMSKLGLIDIYEQARLGARVNLLVVVDQFEELFRYRQRGVSQQEHAYSVSAEATAFVNLLLEVREQTRAPIYVVLTMRSDFLGDCAQFPGLPEAINAGQYLVPRLTRDERRAAISGPVGVGGAALTPVLLTRLVNDVGDNPDQLSILQHALNRTWACWQQQGNGERPLDLPHYDAIGTMAHALDQHAEHAYAKLGGERQRHICAKLFKALVDKATDPRGVRRPTTLGTLGALTAATVAEVTEVIDVFRKPSRSFVMPPAGETLTPETVIDISHESLMRVWERLKTWGEEEARSARIYRRLAETAGLYEKGEANLWRDPDLQVALNWRDQEQPNDLWANRYHSGFTQAMRFLADSVARRDEETRAQEAERQRALEQTQALERAEEQARAARRLLWLSGGLVVILCFAVGAAVYAWHQRKDAEKQRDVAVSTVKAWEEALKAKSQAKPEEEKPEEEKRLLQAQTVLASANRSEGKSTNVQSSAGLIYIQIRPSYSKAKAQQIQQKLKEKQFDVPDIEPLDVGPTTNTEVRYFQKSEEARKTANDIVDILKESFGIDKVKSVFIPGYENSTKVKPKQYEIWFAADALK